MARPKLPDNEKRATHLNLRLTDSEYQSVADEAARHERTVSDYCRKVLLRTVNKTPTKSNKMIDASSLTIRLKPGETLSDIVVDPSSLHTR